MDVVINYLENFDRQQLQILYGHEAFGVAVLRSISALARQYVMRLLLCKDQRTSKITMDRWAKDVSIKEHNDALQRLFKIGVFERLDSSSSTVVQRAQTLLPQQQNEQTDTDNFDIVMSVQFAKSIGSIVLGTRDASDQNTSQTNQPQKPEIEKAQQHAENCWKTLTSLLVNSGGRLPSRKVIDLLVDGGLVHYGARNSSLKITNAGFQFLLQSKASQLWTLIFAYFQQNFETDEPRRKILSFLFSIARLPCGSVIDVSLFEDSVIGEFLATLHGIGVVVDARSKSGEQQGVIVTQLAPLLIGSQHSGAADEQGAGSKDGHVIVETNFRVYAYTESPLHIAILSLFMQPLVRLPNLCVGSITRDSVRAALVAGITAAQILAYLRLHAHPALAGEPAGAVPRAVAEQIALWAVERQRVTCNDGQLYELPTQAMFDAALRVAQRANVVLYHNVDTRHLIVEPDQGVTLMTQFLATQK